MADPFVLVPVADPMIGTVINNFVITRVLGRGGMGAVYLAQHKAAAHIRTVYKTILAHMSRNPLMISRFNTETEAVGRLGRHENIVELKDFGVLPNGQMYMQFEYIDGTPLEGFLAEWGGRLSLHRAIYLAFQVCNALDHAHESNVVHRDLKPDNLLVVIQDQERVPRLVKLVDFGISKVVRTGGTQTISGMKMGTPYFMSVEQYANAAEASGKSDVYSLAIILWLMIAGELPWGRPDPNVLYHVQRTVIPTTPPEHVMPAAVARILLRCLSVDPDNRPTMRELALALAAVIPATDDAPSGGAILLHIAPRFLASSPDHARTVPRAAIANPDGVAAQLWPPIKRAVTPPDAHAEPNIGADHAAIPGLVATPEDAGSLSAEVSQPSLSPPIDEPETATPANATTSLRHGVSAPTLIPPVMPSTRRAAPSSAGIFVASAASGAAAAQAHDLSALAIAAIPTALPIAALPTGLISQKHIAQDPPAEALLAVPRVRSIVAAAEIELACGTPGPEPYAHSELPRVVVSTTQLSGVTPSPSALIPQPARTAEQLPILVLPRSQRPTSHRKLLATGAALCALIVAASVARFWNESRIVADGRDEASMKVRESKPADVAVPLAAEAAAEPARVVGGPVPHTLPVNQQGMGTDVPGSVSSATNPGPVNISADRSDKTATTAIASVKQAPNGAPDTGRTAPARSAPGQKTLRARQVEARSSGTRTGNLHLLVTPWAVCWVDGERIDQTPCMLDDLPVGRYRVRLENSVMHKVETLTATVTSGETMTIERAW